MKYNKIKVTNDHIYILQKYYHLLLFNKMGEYLRKIIDNNIQTFDVKDDLIYLVTDKLLIYEHV